MLNPFFGYLLVVMSCENHRDRDIVKSSYTFSQTIGITRQKKRLSAFNYYCLYLT